MSPQTPRCNDDYILEVKISPKGSFSLCDPKSYPSGSAVNHNPTNKLSGFAGKEKSSIIQMKNDDSLSNDPSNKVDFNVCIESQKEVSSNAKNDINAKEKKCEESDIEEDAINTHQKQKKRNPTYQLMVLTWVISLN